MLQTYGRKKKERVEPEELPDEVSVQASSPFSMLESCAQPVVSQFFATTAVIAHPEGGIRFSRPV